jgi:hypothetical protein
VEIILALKFFFQKNWVQHELAEHISYSVVTSLCLKNLKLTRYTSYKQKTVVWFSSVNQMVKEDNNVIYEFIFAQRSELPRYVFVVSLS